MELFLLSTHLTNCTKLCWWCQKHLLSVVARTCISTKNDASTQWLSHVQFGMNYRIRGIAVNDDDNMWPWSDKMHGERNKWPLMLLLAEICTVIFHCNITCWTMPNFCIGQATKTTPVNIGTCKDELRKRHIQEVTRRYWEVVSTIQHFALCITTFWRNVQAAVWHRYVCYVSKHSEEGKYVWWWHQGFRTEIVIEYNKTLESCEGGLFWVAHMDFIALHTRPFVHFHIDTSLYNHSIQHKSQHFWLQNKISADLKIFVCLYLVHFQSGSWCWSFWFVCWQELSISCLKYHLKFGGDLWHNCVGYQLQTFTFGQQIKLIPSSRERCCVHASENHFQFFYLTFSVRIGAIIKQYKCHEDVQSVFWIEMPNVGQQRQSMIRELTSHFPQKLLWLMMSKFACECSIATGNWNCPCYPHHSGATPVTVILHHSFDVLTTHRTLEQAISAVYKQPGGGVSTSAGCQCKKHTAFHISIPNFVVTHPAVVKMTTYFDDSLVINT